MQAKSGFPDWLFKQKNRNLSLFRSIWLQNFYLAIWLLFGTFATSSLQKFFLKSCEWRVQHVPVSIKRETGHHTVAQCANEHQSVPITDLRRLKFCVRTRPAPAKFEPALHPLKFKIFAQTRTCPKTTRNS